MDPMSKCPGNDDDLWQDLVDFVSIRVAFTIKRLLPADQKNLYTRQCPLDNVEKKFKSSNPFAVDYPITPNQEKGGFNVSENVVYGW